MITLHGFAYSNYYNLVKHVLMHKGIEFQEDENYGGTEEYLAISPVGKIPAMTTAQGEHLSESSVCCDYLEETYPDVPLYPQDSFSRGQVRQVMKISELYLELPARRLIRFVLTRTDAPDEVKEEVRETLGRGIGAINRLCDFSPYVLGVEFTMADIYLRYVMSVVDMTSASKLDWDAGAQMPGLKDWQAMMADTDISRKIDADREANTSAFFEMVRKRFGE